MSDAPKPDSAELSKMLGIDKRLPTLPTRFASAQEDAANLPKHEAKRYNSGPLDSEAGRAHKPADANANFDQKVYMMPESYNALRIELYEHWPNLFKLAGWFMAWDAVRFMEVMDGALDTKTTFDSQTVDAICKKYLDLLRNKRGLSSLHLPSEKA